MKQLALVICYLAMYILLPAQNFTVNLLPDIRKTDPRLVKYQDGYYTIDYEPQYSYRAWSPKLDRIMLNITIKKYGTSFQEAKVVQLPGPDKSYGPLPPALKLIHNKLCLFYTKLAKDNTIVLYVTAIDPVTLETGPPTEVMVIDVDDRDFYQYMMLVNSYSPDFDYKRFSLSSRYGFSKTFIIRQSHNGEYLMVAWAAKLNDKLNLALLDKNMKRIQSKICQLPGKALLSINSACVDNSGNGYFTLAYPQKNDIVHQLFINRKDGSEENKIIDLPSGYIAGIKAVADPKHDRVWFCGPYIENTDNLAGVYQVELDTKTSVWGNVVKTPFDSALVEIFDKENWAKTKMKKYGLYPDIMWEANIFSDGILHLTGEFRDQIYGQRASFDRTGSILNASFRGNKAVFTRIPKIRVSAASTFGDSYRIFGYQNELIVFYNDFPSSLKRSVEEVPERSDVYTSSALLAGIIRADGSLTREIVIDKSKEDFLSGLSNISEFEPGQFFVPLSRIRKLGGITDDIQWTMVKYK